MNYNDTSAFCENENIDEDFLKENGIDVKLLDVEHLEFDEEQPKKKRGRPRSEENAIQDAKDAIIVSEFVSKYNSPIKSERDKVMADVWNRYLYGLTSYAYKIMKDWDVATNMAVETLERAWEKADTYKPDKSKFCTWLYRICRNFCLGEIKKRKDEKISSIDISDMYSSCIVDACLTPTFTESHQFIYEKGKLVEKDINELVSHITDASAVELNKIIGNIEDNAQTREIMEKFIEYKKAYRMLDMDDTEAKKATLKHLSEEYGLKPHTIDKIVNSQMTRYIWNAFVYEGKKLKDIAEELDVNISSIKSKIYGNRQKNKRGEEIKPGLLSKMRKAMFTNHTDLCDMFTEISASMSNGDVFLNDDYNEESQVG